jgi:hypothetical protein
MTDDLDETFVTLLRQVIYETFAEARIPTAANLATMLDQPMSLVGHGLERLAGERALVLQPDGEILMAEPFSAVPTSFVVRTAHTQWWGNCIWDGLGVSAMLRCDAQVVTACPCCGTRLEIAVEKGERITSGSGVAHFVVPASQWWDRIVFT